jgi:hypothetical protein
LGRLPGEFLVSTAGSVIPQPRRQGWVGQQRQNRAGQVQRVAGREEQRFGVGTGQFSHYGQVGGSNRCADGHVLQQL